MRDRDYKHLGEPSESEKKESHRKNRNASNLLLAFFSGLGLGLLVALGLYLSPAEQPSPNNTVAEPEQVAKPEKQGPAPTTAQESSRQKYEFYDILTTRELSIVQPVEDGPTDAQLQDNLPPDELPTVEKPVGRTTVSPDIPPSTESPPVVNGDSAQGPFILQLGSFKNFESADSMKTKLRLIGIHADIQRVRVDGQEIRYRVRTGPHQNAKELQIINRLLNENDLDYELLKLRRGE